MNAELIVSNSQIGAAIRKRRRELALSQEELATMLNITSQQVQRYESGKDRISVEKLQVVAYCLSVPLTHFFSQRCGVDAASEPACERELIVNFRKIRNEKAKELVADFAHRIALLEG